MKRAMLFAGLASGVFLVFFVPTFIFVSKGLANTTLTNSIAINQYTSPNGPLPAAPVPIPPVPTTAPAALIAPTSSPSRSSVATSTTTAGSSTSSSSTARFTTISVNGQSYKAEISDTEALQELGLSYRPSLPTNQVMLFVFPTASSWGIWMKGMNFPLDILWLDSSGTVVDLAQNVAPSTYPNVFTPRSPASYVIEANVGWIATNNVGLGTVIMIH